MGRLVDLHLHSTYSDGILAPTEVVRLAAEAGLAAVSLADHDNIEGTDEALAAGREFGVEVLSAVELSVVAGSFSDVHLLGYGFDHHHPELLASLHEFRAFREGRNERIVARVNDRLAAEGREPIDFAAVRALAGGTVGRPHIAMALMEKGYACDRDEAFKRYLVPCNVPKRYFPVAEAIDLVHRAGGVTVLAHPPYITPSRTAFRELLAELIALGLEGIEVYNTGASRDDLDWYLTEARRHHLIVTGGSDFHGIEGGEITIGVGRGNLRIPYSCVEELRAALSSGRDKGE